jgi:hypothetical protein
VRRLLVILAVFAAVGCGETRHAVNADVTTTRRDPRTCSALSAHGYRACFSAGVYTKPTIERRTPNGWQVLARSLRPPEPSAQWYGGWLSHDRRMLLVDWGFPCDSAVAVFVPTDGGKPRVVTGEADWRKAPLSRGLGWTSGGKARVRLYSSWGGHRVDVRHPLTLLFDPNSPPRTQAVRQPGC